MNNNLTILNQTYALALSADDGHGKEDGRNGASAAAERGSVEREKQPL